MSKKIEIRVKEHELDAIKQLADASRLSVSELTRRALMNIKIEPVQPIPEINRAVYVELSKIGVNLNQIARSLNAKSQQIKSEDLAKLLDALAKIGQLSKAAQAAALGLRS